MGDLEKYTRNVRRCHHSPQCHLGMAVAVMEAKDRFRRLDDYNDFPSLKGALTESIPDIE